MIKECKYCGEVLKKKLDETEGNFRKRQYCDKSCAKKAEYVSARAGMVERYCEHCGKLLNMEVAPALYKSKKFCNQECRTAFYEGRLVAHHKARANVKPGKPRLPNLSFLRR